MSCRYEGCTRAAARPGAGVCREHEMHEALADGGDGGRETRCEAHRDVVELPTGCLLCVLAVVKAAK